MNLLDHLAQLATEATPGNWYSVVNDLVGGMSVGNRDKPLSQYDFRESDRAIADLLHSDADAAFIAAANPQTISALVEVARAAQKVQPGLHVWLDDALAKLDNLEGTE